MFYHMLGLRHLHKCILEGMSFAFIAFLQVAGFVKTIHPDPLVSSRALAILESVVTNSTKYAALLCCCSHDEVLFV